MREVPLTQGKVALVDDEDYERVVAFKWRAGKTGSTGRWYAMREVDGTTEYLHRFLMSAPDGQHVDHVSRDSLDCRRQNLRLVTRSQNRLNSKDRCDNTSGYRGVCWERDDRLRSGGRWLASIGAEGKRQKKLGRFHTAEEAAKAYDQAALQLHGEFAVLNFPRRSA